MRLADDVPLPHDFTDPYSYYTALRSREPVHRTTRGVWLLTRYDDVVFVLRDERFGRKGFRDVLSGPRQSQEPAAPMRFEDPPRHTRLRRRISGVLTASLVSNFRPCIQRIVDDLLDRIPDGPVVDLIADFAFSLPVHVIAELLGIPRRDREKFYEWSTALVKGTGQPPSVDTIADYFADALAHRRRTPRNDLFSQLIFSGDSSNELTEFELVDICGLLFIAGHETTTNLIGNGMLALMRHPDELAKLRGHPALLPSAVEELLRYDSPIQCAGRMAEADVAIGGKTISRGDIVTPIIGAANRDPARFAEPNRLHLERRNNCHLAFGAGERFCLGAVLARMVGQIAIGALLNRFPSLALDHQTLDWRESTETRGLNHLCVKKGSSA